MLVLVMINSRPIVVDSVLLSLLRSETVVDSLVRVDSEDVTVVVETGKKKTLNNISHCFGIDNGCNFLAQNCYSLLFVKN